MRNGHLIAVEGPVTRIVREQSCLLMDAAANTPQWRLPNVFALSLPWDDDSESLVSKLEAGVFGSPPDIYEASLVYLMDIWTSFRVDWGEDYNAGGLAIIENYVPHNFLQQGRRFPKELCRDYNRWLIDTAYMKLHLPAPDTVLYLDVPVEFRAAAGGMSVPEELFQKEASVRETELEIATSHGWLVVDCSDNGQMRTKESIHDEIYAYTDLLFRN